MTKTEMTNLIEELRKTVRVQAETIKTLLAMIAQMSHPQIALAPAPITMPVPAPLPWPPYTPYIGDPPGWLNNPNVICSTTEQFGSATCRMQNTNEG